MILKLALSIITREKSEVEYNQPQSSDRWSVEKTRPRSTNAKHSQKTTPANIIQTCNRFEPLRVDDQIERNGSSQNGNGVVTGHKTSSSSSRIRTRNTNLKGPSQPHLCFCLYARACRNERNHCETTKDNETYFQEHNLQ